MKQKKNPITNSNSKHIEVRHHYLSDLAGRKKMSIIHITSSFQHGDSLTEAISRESFEFNRSLRVRFTGKNYLM